MDQFQIYLIKPTRYAEARLKPIYNYLKATPNLAGAPVPYPSKLDVSRNLDRYSSFDLGPARQRRPETRRESPPVFYPRYWAQRTISMTGLALTYWRLRRMMRRILADPARRDYASMQRAAREEA